VPLVIADTGPSCPVPFGPASQSSAVPYGAFRPKAVAIHGLAIPQTLWMASHHGLQPRG